MSADRPMPLPGVLAIEPYVPGKSKATGGAKLYKLSSNETPHGPSPRAVEAFHAAANRLELYPDGTASELRAAIGRTYGLNPDNIVCGAGSDEILNLIARAFIGPGDEAIHTEHGFLVYNIAIKGSNGTPIIAPETNLTTDVDAILARVTPRTKVIFIANPNNPTGTYLPFKEVRRLHAALPKSVLLVLDAAYAEYVRRNDYESGIELAGSAPNVIMTRTFSKIYGLAALRLGWCYGPAGIIDALNRIRGPFNVSTPAMVAGIAALGDQAHVSDSVAHNEEWLPRLSDAFRKIGLEIVPSVANFILIRFPKEKGRDADAAGAFLSARGIVHRKVAPYGLPDSLRMTIGSDEANERSIAALTEFMGKQ